MSNWSFVIAAHVVTWIAIAAYAFSVLRRHHQLVREQEELNS